MFDVSGYDVLYTATSENAKALKTVTLTVKDEGKPVVMIKGNNVAEVNKRFTFPEISVYDDSGKTENTIEVYDDANHKVSSDEEGFTPAQIGEYELRVTAKDDDGNEGSRVFKIFARSQIKENELDAFDDAGLAYTAYSQGKSGELNQGVKSQAVFSAFKKSVRSGGSAMFESGSGERTGIYLSPRMDSANLQGDTYDYISVWYFIADGLGQEHEVIYGTGKKTVQSNVWQELRITGDEVGNFTRWFFNLRTGHSPIMEVSNGMLPCKVFVDDVYAVKTAENRIDGLKESYAMNEAVTFTAGSGVKTDLYYNGTVEEAESGVLPEQAGQYTLFAYANDDTTVEAYNFTVGTLSVDTLSQSWFTVGKDSKLPRALLTDGDQETDGEIEFYLYNLVNGEKTEITDKTVRVNDNSVALFLQAESAAGIKTSRLVFPVVSVYEAGMILDYSNPNVAASLEGNGEWLEEYKGLNGVMRMYSDGKLSDRAMWSWGNWTPIFAKDYYGSFTHITFELYAEGADRFTSLAYAVENAVHPDGSVHNHDIVLKGKLVDGYNRVSLPMDEFLPFYQYYVEQPFFWIGSSDSFNLYFDAIRATNELTVTNQAGDNVIAGSHTLSDDHVSVFTAAGCEAADIERKIYSSDGLIAESGDTFVVEGDKTYTVVYSAIGSDGRPYTASYSFTAWNEKYRDTLYAIDSESDLGGRHDNITFLDSYEGETGVMKVKGGADWQWLMRGVTPVFRKDYYSNVDLIVLRVRTDSKFTFALLAENSPAPYCDTVTVTNRDSWLDYAIPIDPFYNNWEDYVGALMLFSNGNGENTNLYISEIRVAKKAEIANNTPDVFAGNYTINDNKQTAFAGCTDLQCKVYEEGTELVISGDTFTTVAGKTYTVVYTAKDSGRDVYGSYSFVVHDLSEAGLVYDFATVNGLGGYNTEKLEWLASYQGETGVVKFTNGATDWDTAWCLNGIKPLFGKTYYDQCDYLVLRLYSSEKAWMNFAVEGDSADDRAYINFQTNGEGWADYYVPIDGFLGKWDMFGTSILWATHARELYLSEIRAVKKAEITSQITGNQALGSEITLSDNAGTAIGANAVCTVLTPTQGEIAVTNGKFTPTEEGVYTVRYRAISDTGIITQGSYTIAVKDGSLLYDFRTQAGLGGYNTQKLEWLASYQGETGVVKFTNGATDWDTAWCLNGIKPLFGKTYYDQCDYLVLRLYSSEKAWMNFAVEGDSADDRAYINFQTNGEGWADYYVPIDGFLGKWDMFGTSILWATHARELYLSEIRAVKKAEITSQITGNQALGSEITLSDNAGTAIGANAVCTVLTPTQGEIAVTNGKFTPTEEGVYTVRYRAISATGIITQSSYTIAVKDGSLLYDFRTQAGLGGYKGDGCLEWLGTYDGRNDVVKFTNLGAEGEWCPAWLCRDISPIFSKEYYQEFNFVEFELYSTEACWFKLFAENVGDADENSLVFQTSAETGWHTYKISITPLLEHWDDFTTQLMLSTHLREFYISSLRVTK